MHMCGKCRKMMGMLLLVVGVLFLLQDLKIWNFWGLNWYTLVFLLMAIKMMASSCCKECKLEEKKRK